MKKILHKFDGSKKMLNRILNSSFVFTLINTFVFANSSPSQNTTLNDGTNVDEIVDSLNQGEGIYGIIQEIASFLLFIATAISVFKLIQIGIMFLMGAGKGRNEAKAAMFPWVIGLAICALCGTLGPAIIKLIVGEQSGGVFDI